MTWTPAAPPASTWAKGTTTPSSWIAEPRPFAAWDVEITTDVERITEARSVRITEQGDIRIIERFGDPHWSNETLTVNPWTKE